MISMPIALLFVGASLLRGALNIYKINVNAMYIKPRQISSYLAALVLSFCNNVLALLMFAYCAIHYDSPTVAFPLLPPIVVFAALIGTIGIVLTLDERDFK